MYIAFRFSSNRVNNSPCVEIPYKDRLGCPGATSAEFKNDVSGSDSILVRSPPGAEAGSLNELQPCRHTRPGEAGH